MQKDETTIPSDPLKKAIIKLLPMREAILRSVLQEASDEKISQALGDLKAAGYIGDVTNQFTGQTYLSFRPRVLTDEGKLVPSRKVYDLRRARIQKHRRSARLQPFKEAA